MRIVKANLEEINKNGIIIKMSNGIKTKNLIVNKKDMTFEDFKELRGEYKVMSWLQGCCTSSPIVVLESGKSEKEDNEMKEVINKVIEMIGEELKKCLK